METDCAYKEMLRYFCERFQLSYLEDSEGGLCLYWDHNMGDESLETYPILAFCECYEQAYYILIGRLKRLQGEVE